MLNVFASIKVTMVGVVNSGSEVRRCTGELVKVCEEGVRNYN